jgi:hypothetical protein
MRRGPKSACYPPYTRKAEATGGSTKGIDLKSHRIGFLIDGRDLAQEPAVLLLVPMMDLLERPEWKLHVVATRKRRGHFIENEIEKLLFASLCLGRS